MDHVRHQITYQNHLIITQIVYQHNTGDVKCFRSVTTIQKKMCFRSVTYMEHFKVMFFFFFWPFSFALSQAFYVVPVCTLQINGPIDTGFCWLHNSAKSNWQVRNWFINVTVLNKFDYWTIGTTTHSSKVDILRVFS